MFISSENINLKFQIVHRINKTGDSIKVESFYPENKIIS